MFGNSRVNAIVNAIRIIKYGYMIKKTLNSTELKLKLTLYFSAFKRSSENPRQWIHVVNVTDSHLGVRLSQSSFHGKESKIVLDFVFHAVDSGFQVLDLRFLAAGSWIPHTNRQWIPESLSCIPDSKVRISDFTSKDFSQAKSLGFRISLHGSTKLYSRLLHLSMNLKSKQLLTHNHSPKKLVLLL